LASKKQNKPNQMASLLKILAQNEQGTRCRFSQNGLILSFKEVFSLWQTSVEATESFVNEMKKLGFDQWYWEHPAVTKDLMELPYECMILKTKHFDRRKVDTEPFSAHIHQENFVAVFDNLGHNARLIVPTWKSEKENYKHLGAFINFASTDQVLEIFKTVGNIMEEELSKGK